MGGNANWATVDIICEVTPAGHSFIQSQQNLWTGTQRMEWTETSGDDGVKEEIHRLLLQLLLLFLLSFTHTWINTHSLRCLSSGPAIPTRVGDKAKMKTKATSAAAHKSLISGLVQRQSSIQLGILDILTAAAAPPRANHNPFPDYRLA